jgi:hypothetical protein
MTRYSPSEVAFNLWVLGSIPSAVSYKPLKTSDLREGVKCDLLASHWAFCKTLATTTFIAVSVALPVGCATGTAGNVDNGRNAYNNDSNENDGSIDINHNSSNTEDNRNYVNDRGNNNSGSRGGDSDIGGPTP